VVSRQVLGEVTVTKVTALDVTMIAEVPYKVNRVTEIFGQGQIQLIAIGATAREAHFKVKGHTL